MKGDLEKTKINKELNKVTISFSLFFADGTNSKSISKCLVNYQRDTSVITWPPTVAPKRTRLTIGKVRQIIKSSNQSLETGLVQSLSNENIDEHIEGKKLKSIQRTIGRRKIFISKSVSEKIIEKLKAVFGEIIIGDLRETTLEKFAAVFLAEGEKAANQVPYVFEINNKSKELNQAKLEELKNFLEPISDYFQN